MAYYYFDSFDHVSTKHNSDVYLVANVGNYHDYNGEEYASYFAGFTIKGGYKFTLGGNYTYDAITGNTIFNINRFQKVRKQSSEGAAIMFDGSGTFVIASQIGAPDGAQHDDRAVQIWAENRLSNASYILPEPDTAINFNLRVQPTPNAWNSEYEQTGQNADISGVHAKNGTLTIASHYNGTITVKGGHSSRGMLDSTGKALINTTVNTHSVATGLRGDKAIRFNGNFYGNLDVTQRTHLQTLNKVLTDNISAAYGVWTSSDLNQSHTWSGGIFTCTQKNYFDATIAYDVDGKKSAANGVLKNNTVESICIKANSIYINHLDYEPNTSGHGSFNPIAEPDNLATYKNFSITVNGKTTNIVSDVNKIGATMAPGDVDYYFIEAPKSIQNLALNTLITIDYDNPIKTEKHSATGTVIAIDGIKYLRMDANDTTEKLYGFFKDDSAEVNTNTVPMTDYWQFISGSTTHRFTKEELVLDEAGTKFYYPKTDTSTPDSAILTWDATAVSNAQYIIYLDNGYTVHATADNTGKTISKVEIFDRFGNPVTGVVKTSTVQLVNDKFKLELDTSFNAYKVENIFQYDPSKGFSSVLESHDNNEGKLTLTFIANTNNLTNFEAEFDLITSDPSYFQSKTSNVDLSNFKTPMITALGGGLYLYTLESKDLDKNFIVYKDLPANVVLKAKTEGNVFKVDGTVENSPSDTMTNNKIQAIAIEAQDKVEIRNFSKGSVIEVSASNNTMQSIIKDNNDTDNSISAIGIKGKTVQLHDFNGTIVVKANDNTIDSGSSVCQMTFAGINADTLNISKNLYGIIEVSAHQNSLYTTAPTTSRGDRTSATSNTSGILVTDMNVDGFINSNISVITTGADTWFASGIYVAEKLDAKGFSGDIYVNSNNSEVFGIYAKTFDSEIGYYFENYNYTSTNGQIGRLAYAQDVFNVEGRIYVTGSNTRHVHAIATTATANLHLNGYVYSSNYAIKTDFGKDVSTGFNNDWVTLGANAEVTGIIDLGGGKNRLTFDSSAEFYGHVVHDVGTTNITYQLNGTAQTGAIHNVNSIHDATLVSGVTITIDCNNMKLGDTYALIDYDDYIYIWDYDKNCDIADARWTNSYVNVSYQGKNNMVYINGGVSDVVALTGNNGKKFYVQLRYDKNSNTLSFASAADKNETTPENIVAPSSNIAVISVATSIEPLTGIELESVSISNKNEAMLNTFNNAMSNLNNNSAPDYVVYDIDELSRNATADTTIYWMCEAGNYKNSAYEIEYTVKDAQGNTVSSAIMRMTTVNENNKTFTGTVQLNGYTQPVTGKIILVNNAGKTQEQLYRENPSGNVPFEGKYYIMSYDINSLPEGCTVEYRVRDYISEGTLVSEWVSGSINTNVQDFTSTIEDIDSSSMIAVSPDTKTQEITNSMALFTWAAAKGNYPVDKYTVQYFSSSVNLSANAEKRQILFDAYTYADKGKYDEWQPVKNEAGENVPNLEIRLVKGDGSTPAEIQIREVVDEIEAFGTKKYIYQYYNFVSKEVTSTELLASGLANQSYIYWRIQATSSADTAQKNNWVEGQTFTIGINNSPNITPDINDDPEDPSEITETPVGVFKDIAVPTVTPEIAYTSTGNGVTTEQVISADITFSWTDTFEAVSTNAEVAYIFQVSDSRDFDSDRTETILLLPSSMSEEDILKIYQNASEKYSYYDEQGIKHQPLLVFNGVDSWRVGSESYTTTVTFDNSYPTVPVGMFINPTNYWQVKAIDTYGNEAEFCNVQSFKPTYTVKETYTEVNPETGVLETKERDIIKNIYDLAPAKAYDLHIKTPEQENGKNTGKIELVFSVNNENMGIDKVNITINGKDISGKALAADTLSIEKVIMTDSIENAGRVEFTKELMDVLTVDGNIVSEQYLTDGTYTVTVTTYNSHGSKVTSDKYTFVQDTTRPVIQVSSSGGSDKSTISATFKNKAENGDRITVTVAWPIATDNFDGKKASSNIKGYYLWYKSSEAEEWQAVRINNSVLLTKTQYDITLNNHAKYDFKVVAIDNSNNQSDPVEVKGIEIYYNDIDENYVPPVTSPQYAPVSIKNEIIGGEFDAVDIIHVSTDNGTGNAGRITFSVKNLTQIRGNENSITISLYEDNGGLKLLKTYTISGKSAAQTSSGINFEYLLAESGKQYFFEVKAANSTTVMKYDFDYNVAYYPKDAENNTAYQLDDKYVINFNDKIVPIDVPEDPTGNIKRFNVTLPNQNFVGYKDATNTTRLKITYDGKYTFTVSKKEKDSLSALKVTIYSAVAGSTTLKTVQSITVAANKLEAAINDLELKAGDYIVQVTSPNATSGASINYSVEVSSMSDKYFAFVDNSDDVYNTAKSTVSALDKNTNIIFGNVKTEDNETLIYSEFIGKTDLSDVRKVSVDESGKYTFKLYKFSYINTAKEKELVYGEDGNVTLTIYEINDNSSELKKVKSLTVAAKTFEKELDLYLDKGEYYVEVKANSAKTALDYYVSMEKHQIEVNGKTYTADGSSSITRDFALTPQYSQTITNEVGKVYYFNNAATVEEQKNTFEFAGFGEKQNYFEVIITERGDYTFSINRSEFTKGTDYSALKATLYTTNQNGDGFTAVKSVTLKNNAYSSLFTLNNLTEGTYFIEVTAADAEKGKYAVYNLSVKTNQVYAHYPTHPAPENYVDAKEYTSLGTTVKSDSAFYKFDTANLAGMFELTGVNNLYYLKDGSVNLTKVKLSSDNTAYLDANTTYYVGVNNGDEFTINEKLVQDLSQYNSDNKYSDLTGNTIQNNTSFSSWVGYGDLESWRKLELDQSGNFNLSLHKNSDQAASGTAMTVTVYKLADNGSMKAVGNFSVKANAYDAMKNFLLEAGDYYIQVKSTTAQGYSDFTLNIYGDGTEDSFTAKADQEFNDTALTDATVTITNQTSVTNWVGYGDEYDYFNIKVTADGYYDFNFTNTDAAQLTLYIVNPDNSKLTAVASYTAKTAGSDGAVFLDKNGNGILLNDSSQYIAMVKSTNAKKGGNCDYNFSILSYKDVHVFEFVIEENCAGKYEFTNLMDGVSIKQFNEATGKLSDVKLTNDIASLKAGTYFLTSPDYTFSYVDIDTANKFITIA